MYPTNTSTKRKRVDRLREEYPLACASCLYFFGLCSWVLICFLSVVAVCHAAPPTASRFEQDIAPLLATRCVSCHNRSQRRGELDLTHLASAQKGGESGSAIVAGNAEESTLIERITDAEMPPEGKGKPLSAAQIATLARWIDAGATWPKQRVLSQFEQTTDRRAGNDWWSLRRVVRPAVPQIKSDWINNPIDAFVLQRLRAHGLSPAPPAERRLLLRRVTFDLTGLPPTMSEAEEFLNDNSSEAYARLVDRLLASSRYGERWARHWLDVAHYADTHGFERDFRRDNAWPYRDYVIAALNNDKPYDRFLREQIAGDVIAPNDPEQVAATGFLSAGPWDFVGHKENKDPKFRRLARADDLDDMVATVITATLGLTANCSRCHDHKFDPIPQSDYYRLTAVFAGIRRGDRELPHSQQVTRLRKQLQEINKQLAPIDGDGVNLADIIGGGSGVGGAAGFGKYGTGIDPRSGKSTSGGTNGLTATANKFVKVSSPLIDGVFVPDPGPGSTTPVTITSTGIQVSALPDTSGGLWDYINLGPSRGFTTTLLGGVDYNTRPRSMLSLHANKGITFDVAAIRRATGYRKFRFRTIAGYGGAAGANSADVWVFVDGKLRASQRGLSRANNALRIDIPITPEQRFLTLVATDGGNGISHDQVFFGDPRLVPLDDDSDGNTKKKTETKALRLRLNAESDKLRKQISQAAPHAKRLYGVVSGKAPPVHIQQRGNPETPGALVQPGVLTCLTDVTVDWGDSEMGEGGRRLALARWITDRRNPLTARVIVNRLWHHHFGRGIVATPSDFGFQGGKPSHPLLLDYLASELPRRGWSLKAIHRLILLSNTYRQSNTYLESAAAIDADNRLLWRHRAMRLEAEAVRDTILAVSGKINLTMGGPGYQDFKFIDRYAPIYRYITADSPPLWRRSIYRFTVRSVPNPLMRVLDCPNPSNRVPSRSQTTTALQPLALMNDAFVIKQAGYFAERVVAEAGLDPTAQVRRAYELAFCRTPNDQEIRLATRLVSQQSLFHLCRMLFNANEFVYVD